MSAIKKQVTLSCSMHNFPRTPSRDGRYKVNSDVKRFQ